VSYRYFTLQSISAAIGLPGHSTILITHTSGSFSFLLFLFYYLFYSKCFFYHLQQGYLSAIAFLREKAAEVKPVLENESMVKVKDEYTGSAEEDMKENQDLDVEEDMITDLKDDDFGDRDDSKSATPKFERENPNDNDDDDDDVEEEDGVDDLDKKANDDVNSEGDHQKVVEMVKSEEATAKEN
jgi:hypothetical protein